MATQTATRPEAKETLPNPDPRYDLLAAVPQEWFRLKVTGQDLRGVIHGVKGWYVDDNFEFRREDKDNKNIVSPVRIITGREFIGIPQLRRTGIYRKRWQWGTYFPKAEGEKVDPEYQPKMHEKEIISNFPFVSNYPLIFSEVDVQGRSDPKFDEPPMTQIVFKTIIRVRMLRPRIALMQNTDWLGAGVSQVVRGDILDFVREKTYDDLVRKKTSFNEKNSDFYRKFVGESSTLENGRTQVGRSPLNKSILEQYGVEIIDFRVVDINANEEFEKQLRELANADIAAEILLRNARAEAEKRKLQGQGEEDYIRATAKATKDKLTMMMEAMGGDLSSVKAVIYAEALKETSITTLAGQGIGLVIGADGQLR